MIQTETPVSPDCLSEGLSRYIPEGIRNYFSSRTIGIIGCGGLGSHCAFMLARSGFQKFILMDGDVVEPSNLNRQMYLPRHVGLSKARSLRQLLLELSPGFSIEVKDRYFTPQEEPDLFSCCDYLVEAVDRADVKGAVLNFCPPHNRWIVSASGLGHWTDLSRIKTRVLGSGSDESGSDSPVIVLVGDGACETGPGAPPLMPGVVTAAAAQVHALMKQAVKESGYDWN